MAQNDVWKFLEELQGKKGITEVMINHYDKVFIEREGKYTQVALQILERDLAQFIDDVKKFNNIDPKLSYPLFDGVLPDGSRINIVDRPFALECPVISIRKYLKKSMSFETDAQSFSLTPDWVVFIKSLIAARKSIIIAGSTGVGKTTFMNMLLKEIPLSHRLLMIEDVFELSVDLPNCVRLQTGMDRQLLGRLIENSLRMRPDRIVIGEIRGAEFFHFVMAMNTGHQGSFCTIHANNAQEVIQRLESLFLLGGHDVPFSAMRKQISTSIDFIFYLSRNDSGRMISQVIEVTKMEGDQIATGFIGQYNQSKSRLTFTGLVPQCMKDLCASSNLIGPDFFNIRSS